MRKKIKQINNDLLLASRLYLTIEGIHSYYIIIIDTFKILESFTKAR